MRIMKKSASFETPARVAPCRAVQALTAVALALPGLTSLPASAESAPVTLTKAQSVRAQAYVPTGASRITGTLPKPAESIKRYRIECYDDGSGLPTQVKARIQGKTRTAPYGIKATLESVLTGNRQEVTDIKHGDGLYSLYAHLKEGEGPFILTVSKTKKKISDTDKKLNGKTVFETRQECDTQTNAYTGIRKPVAIP